MSLPFFSVGHSNRTLEEFTDLLRAGEVRRVVDVRTIRQSRANPQYGQEVLSHSLPTYGMAYQPIPALGGRRAKSKAVPPEVNGFWENQSFHNYADYALTDEFQAGLQELILLGHEQRTAFMCAEAVWWRCHRRIICDYLLARGETVIHLMGHDRLEAAQLTKGAVVEADGLVNYPAN